MIIITMAYYYYVCADMCAAHVCAGRCMCIHMHVEDREQFGCVVTVYF